MGKSKENQVTLANIHTGISKAKGINNPFNSVMINGNEFAYGKRKLVVCETPDKSVNKITAKLAELTKANLFNGKVGLKSLKLTNPTNPDFTDSFVQIFNSGLKHSSFARIRGIGNFEADKFNGNVSYITGSCLFGVKNVIAKTENNEDIYICDPALLLKAEQENIAKIKEIIIKDDWHPYEVINSFERHLIFSQTNAKQINCNLPFMPYVLNAHELKNAGIMDNKIFDTWVKAIIKRVNSVLAFERKITSAKINFIDPLCEYSEDITSFDLTFDSLINKLKQNAWWDRYINIYKPMTFSDIGFASYLKAYYDCAAENPQNLIIAAEELNEVKILERLKKGFFKNMGLDTEVNIVAFYPFPRIIPVDQKGYSEPLLFSETTNKKDFYKKLIKHYAKLMNPSIRQELFTLLNS